MEQLNGLDGLAAFEALSHQIWTGGEPIRTVHPSYARLSHAVATLGTRSLHSPSSIDLAVLVRQALRFQQEATGALAQLHVPVGGDWPSLDQWQRVGVHANITPDGTRLQASPWNPTWLPDVPDRGVDGHAAGEELRRDDDRVPGDPFLSLVHRDRYKTRGQRSAVRASFMTPPRASLAITLPTGDGKSFIFQLLAALSSGLGVPGVTLVVTPTIALAEDHEIAAIRLGLGNHRLAYTSGTPIDERRQMRDRIRMGTQGLCFSSPEAVCTTLHASLLDAARAGFLQAIVVDEAHLVDAWGASFRASFQALSGVRSELVEASPPDRAPRTILLSATMTTTTVETLRTLFADEEGNQGLGFLSAAQLRPEIEYWVSPKVPGATQRERVFDTVLHMPRPAILYATEVEKARNWYRQLRAQGFRRIGLMTGKSNPDERRDVVRRWREETLDLVVGTSAFGLGIDNLNVRCVVHACVPETLDRFYQEVGRGGRDGRAAASIIIPSERDVGIARSLSRRQLLTVERAFDRWQSMIRHKRSSHEADAVFKLAIDVPPGIGDGRQDMAGDLNTEWHLRTLTLMANAKMIKLLGPDNETIRSVENVSEEGQEFEESAEHALQQYQRVRIDDSLHPLLEHWQQTVSALRERLVASSRANYERMLQLLQGGTCVSDLLAEVYEIELSYRDGRPNYGRVHVAKACAGCPDCRSQGRLRPTDPAQNARFAWVTDTPVENPARSALGRGNRVAIFYSDEDVSTRRQLRRWIEALAELVSCGVSNWAILPNGPIDPADIQRYAYPLPVFHSSDLPPNDLPPGHTALILGQGDRVGTPLLRERAHGASHFLFMHADIEDPYRPGLRLRDRFDGRKFDLEDFIRRVRR